MVEGAEGLKKKYHELQAHCATLEQSLALYTQRCADLEIERQTYLASHAKLVRQHSPVPGLPLLHRDLPHPAILIGMAVNAVLTLVMILVVALS